MFRLIQAYSIPCVTITYSQPCHILSPSICRTGTFLKTLWNVDQAYSELCHRALFGHIQNPVQLLHMQKPSILGILEYLELFHNCIQTHIHNPDILTKIYECLELWHISNLTHIQKFFKDFRLSFFAKIVKACVCYFHQIFIFSPNDSPSKTMKNAFYFI